MAVCSQQAQPLLVSELTDTGRVSRVDGPHIDLTWLVVPSAADAHDYLYKLEIKWFPSPRYTIRVVLAC